MGKGRLPTASVSKGSKHIPAAAVPAFEDVLLSFKHLTLSDKFTPADRPATYILTVLERFKKICQCRPHELKEGGDEWRCHPIRWQTTTEPDGFKHLPEIFRDITPMQIGLGRDEGRVHGFFIGSVFFLVWFDAKHNLSR
jgi:hypothetical protein